MVRLFRLITLTIYGAYLGRAVFAMIFETRDGYSYELEWKLRGTIVGALCGVAFELLIRRNQPLQARFSMSEMLVAMTILAFVVGTCCIPL
ncbi:MAG TPA: hypothetical protein VHK01_19250 [Lacipirellulaceae bacterium]|nr:hypothetical protein [Lacipirellulaceae bacterium]